MCRVLGVDGMHARVPVYSVLLRSRSSFVVCASRESRAQALVRMRCDKGAEVGGGCMRQRALRIV